MEKSDDIRVRFQQLKKTSDKKYNPAEHNDKTRSKVAMTFVYGFFILTGGSLILSMIYNTLLAGFCSDATCLERMIDVKDMLLAVVGYIGSPLGFIMGFYFKGKYE